MKTTFSTGSYSAFVTSDLLTAASKKYVTRHSRQILGVPIPGTLISGQTVAQLVGALLASTRYSASRLWTVAMIFDAPQVLVDRIHL